jgi:hypothetical protein
VPVVLLGALLSLSVSGSDGAAHTGPATNHENCRATPFSFREAVFYNLVMKKDERQVLNNENNQ